MDLKTFNTYGAGGIAQYDMPQNYELVGRKFEFIMDDGVDYTLNFIDKDTVEWNFENEAPQKSGNYLCQKADDTTFLVSIELADTKLRTNHTWVIDLENQLVTRILAVIGDHPKFEYLIRPQYEFGAIKNDEKEFSIYPRHGFTDDMNGNIVQWFYGSEMTTVHVYYCSDFYRITYPPERAASRVFNETLAKLPSSDEPTAYIKIKEGMYLFSLTESNSEKLIGDTGAFPFRSNTMCMLQNYKRVYLVGRAFGTTMFDNALNKLHISFSAFGRILQPSEEYILQLLTDPNPYLV